MGAGAGAADSEEVEASKKDDDAAEFCVASLAEETNQAGGDNGLVRI